MTWSCLGAWRRFCCAWLPLPAVLGQRGDSGACCGFKADPTLFIYKNAESLFQQENRKIHSLPLNNLEWKGSRDSVWEGPYLSRGHSLVAFLGYILIRLRGRLVCFKLKQCEHFMIVFFLFV